MHLTIYKECRQVWFLSYDERHKKHVRGAVSKLWVADPRGRRCYFEGLENLRNFAASRLL